MCIYVYVYVCICTYVCIYTCIAPSADEGNGIILTKGPTIRSCEYLDAGEMMDGGPAEERR